MGIKRFDIEAHKYSTLTLELAIKNEEETSSEDLTGWTIFFTVKESKLVGDSGAIISEDITSHYDALNGITRIEISSADLNTIDSNVYYYDIKYLDDSGNLGYLYEGNFVVTNPVTRRES